MTSGDRRQPYLHDLLTAVRAPAMALTGADGQIGSQPGTATGIYLSDRRIISVALISVDGAELRPIAGQLDGAAGLSCLAVLGSLGDPGPDPTVLLSRRLRVDGTRAVESIEVRSSARAAVRSRLRLRLASDLADLAEVKSGQLLDQLPVNAVPGGLSWTGPDGSRVLAQATPAAQRSAGPAELSWDLQLATGQSMTIELVYTLTGDPTPQAISAPSGSSLRAPVVRGGDRRLARLVQQSVADLAALELADPRAPQDHFLAAGAPWYLTLFGRDSLIAARMLLPLGTELAAGTLRTLARRQGSRVDEAAAEEPGKILHEIRRAETQHGAASHAAHPMRLPPTYYGTVDATPLWVLLLHDSWRWGMPVDQVRELLPNLDRALAWMRDYGMDSSGFLRYHDHSGHGLANQGWKDSHDAIQFRDGRLAGGPLALAEVQGYGYAAAMLGAQLLDAHQRPGGDQWRGWARELATRFRQQFWISDPAGDYPAMALDAAGERVDSVASNMGHLLGTGLLNSDETALVVQRLGSTELTTGFGLRTMGSSSTGFNPLSYHCGSIWTHDTAITITGLASAAADRVPGAAATASSLIDGLLAAAAGFDYRMPELFSGAAGTEATPYPASCRPQAWSAAAAIAILSAVLGPRPDAPADTLSFQPLAPSPVGELTVRGLRFAGKPLDVELSAEGTMLSGADAR